MYPACQNLLLAARALGYGGAFTGWNFVVDAELRELLGVPEGTFIAGTITLGRPAGHHGPVRRRPMGELVYEELWEQAAEWAVRLIKRGRKYGIVLLLATQSPTKDSIPREVTRNISCGAAFSVADQVANDGLLGSGKVLAMKSGTSGQTLHLKFVLSQA